MLNDLFDLFCLIAEMGEDKKFLILQIQTEKCLRFYALEILEKSRWKIKNWIHAGFFFFQASFI